MQADPIKIQTIISYPDMPQPLMYSFSSNMTVRSLKNNIGEQLDLQQNEYTLASINPNEPQKYLLHNEKTIGEFAKGNKLELQINKIGHRDPTMINLTQAQIRTLQVRAVTNNRSTNRVTPGISLHSKCSNEKCERYNRSIKSTLHQNSQKFSIKFNIGKQIFKVKCSLCGIIGKPATNMGFYQCKAYVEAQKNDGEEVNTKIVADGNKYYTFNENGAQNFCIYAFIEVWAERL